VTFETYNRWFGDYTKQRNYLRARIGQIGKDHGETFGLLRENIGFLTDIGGVYVRADTRQKQELIRTVFDQALYYQDGIYRTPYLIPELAHNELVLKEKGLLIVEKKTGLSCENPLSHASTEQARSRRE
jgi:site-specific DNA recombinase